MWERPLPPAVTLQRPLLAKRKRAGKGEMFAGSTSNITKQAKEDGLAIRNKKIVYWQKVQFVCYEIKQVKSLYTYGLHDLSSSVHLIVTKLHFCI